MTLNVLALAITACATSGLGLLAYLRARDHPSNRSFAAHTVAVTTWVMATWAIEQTSDPAILEALLRWAHVACAFSVATLVDFAWVFPGRQRLQGPRRRIALYAFTAAISLIAAHPALIKSVAMTPTGLSVQFGWPLIAFAIGQLALLIHVGATWWRKFRTGYGVARVQTLYVLVGITASACIILITNVILPVATGRTDYSRWGVVGYQITIAAIAISIAKYHLWDLGSLGRRFVAAALAVSTLTPLGIVMVWGLSERARMFRRLAVEEAAVIWLTVGVLFGVSLMPLYQVFSGLVLRSHQRDRQRIAGLLSSLGAAVVHAPGHDAVLMPILQQARQFFGVEFVSAYLKRADGSYVNSGLVATDGETARSEIGPGGSLPRDLLDDLQAESLSQPLDAEQLSRFGPVSQTARSLEAMAAMHASIVAPLLWHGETIGLLFFGRKLSRDMYPSSDIDIVRSVAAHAVLAARNAELRAEIVSEKERTEKVLAQMESGVVAIDASRIIRLVNPAARRLLGRQHGEDMIGQGVALLPNPLQEMLLQALDERVVVSGERKRLEPERGPRLACNTFMLRGRDGRCEGAGIVFRDLSTEDTLQQLERETERLQFIRVVSAGMAHEIRNPLVAIRTFTELVPTRMDDPEFRDSFVHVAQSEINRLEGLVSQFMTLARPTREVREPVDLCSLSADVMATLAPSAEAKGVHTAVDIPVDLPQPLGDEQRLHQALLNLLLNALDATPEGGSIRVSATAHGGDRRDAHSIVWTVWNSGSYISPEDRERVFEPFFTGKAMGTGLGLAICHTIVDEHGGMMEIESDRETGTCFLIRLPVAAAAESVMANAS